MSRFDGSTPVMSRPSTKTRPVVGSSSPARTLSVVDFPQPLGPTRTTNSPSEISRVKSERATELESYVFPTDSNLTEAN